MQRTTGALVALTLVLAGCSSGARPSTTGPVVAPPSAGASYTCSPLGGTPAPCSPEEYTQEQMRAQVAQEAEGVYRRLFAELAALQRGGGSPTPSPELTTLAGGSYLNGQQATLTQLQQRQAKLTGEVRIKTLRPAPGALAKGFDTALFACVDATGATMVQGDKELQKGQLIAETVYFRRDGNLLKAWDAEKADPQAC